MVSVSNEVARPMRMFLAIAILVNGAAAGSRGLQGLTADSECVAGDVDLAFSQATVTHNNLGNIGPDTGDETIVFSNVGNFQGESINMVLSIAPGAEYVPTDLDRNGMICTSARRSCEVGGDFGQVNLKSNHETTLKFQFQSDSTGEPVVLPGFLFSGLDIDGQLIEETYVIRGWDTAFYDSNNTEAYFSENEPGFCDGGGNCLYAHSTMQGSVCDNPLDAFTLGPFTCADRTVNQLQRSFLLTFSNKSEFEVYFKATRPARDYGRNFLFAFASSWAESCMLMPTIPPTMAPIAATTTPTMAPTTVSPTIAPSTLTPTMAPSIKPTTAGPTGGPTAGPTAEPTAVPTPATTIAATVAATDAPVMAPVTSAPVPAPVTSAPVAPTCTSGGKSGKGGKGYSGSVEDDVECGGKAGKAGSGKAGSGKAGSGKAGSGKAGSGLSTASGKAGSGKAGSGLSGKAGSGKGSDTESAKGKSSKTSSTGKAAKGTKEKKTKSVSGASVRGSKLEKA